MCIPIIITITATTRTVPVLFYILVRSVNIPVNVHVCEKPPICFGSTYSIFIWKINLKLRIRMNQRENGPETGGASGDATPLDVIEDFANRPPTNAEKHAPASRSRARNARPPADDPISCIAWPTRTPGSFVNDFQETGLF